MSDDEGEEPQGSGRTEGGLRRCVNAGVAGGSALEMACSGHGGLRWSRGRVDQPIALPRTFLTLLWKVPCPGELSVLGKLGRLVTLSGGQECLWEAGVLVGGLQQSLSWACLSFLPHGMCNPLGMFSYQ